MEEVDSIILQFLRSLNLNIDEEITSLNDLSVETIIEAAYKCIFTINKSIKVPTKLPNGISQRIEVAGQIASCCKDLGYKNDVGYQTFLYFNETELRQVFMFLIERLPSESKKPSLDAEKNTNRSLLMHVIGKKIGEEFNTIWIPPCCMSTTQKLIGDDFQVEQSTVNSRSLLDKEIIEKLIAAKKQTIKVHPQEREIDNTQLSECFETTIINESLQKLKEMAITLKQKLDTLESDKNLMEVEYNQAYKLYEKSESDLRNIQSIFSSIGISDKDIGSGNILERVQRNIDVLHIKSEELTSKNLSLKVQTNNLKNNNSLKESEKGKCIKILSSLKETAKQIKDEYAEKEKEKDQLLKELNKIKKGNKRSVYTKRIMEIISNVDKQNMEIKKILEDTRQLQKDINSLEGQLERCFSIADETLFRDAKKDDQAKKAYKLLALLHSECNTIVNLVNDTGCLARDIIDLEDNIKTQKAKRTEDILVKIQLDLSRMQEENLDQK